ncbi:hypothetical protein FRB94_013216 [Tulasnella sp. JGI-2019a]|nr:hypothetical protein FRB93_011790 [Tulasnella sp. JGI-2019a]KAG9008492.1 hypothetical protein FRB94_013216 [Tulasnella sp. JGI-2019a]KAG9034770.1 hypothetical protein FRB95_012591 [Tulasnella sp. JGI-2019a]
MYSFEEETWDSADDESPIPTDPQTSPPHFAAIPYTPSLFDDLPVELVASIFSHLSRSTAANDQEHSKIALLLSSVSKRFRSIAAITSDLWTTIVIPPLNKSIEHVPKYVARSATLPLDVIINLLPLVPAYQRRGVFKKRLSSLEPERHRWSTLHLHFPKQWKDISSVLPDELPNLKDFRIECEGLGWGVMMCTTTAQRLTRLETVCVNLDWQNISWGSLEELQVNYVNCDEEYWQAFLETIRLNVQLRVFKIKALRKEGQTHHHALPTPPIVLPNLHTLHVTKMISGNLVGQLLAILDAPRLRELVISGAGHQTSAEWSFQATPFHFPALERLLLRDIPGAVQVVRQSLQWAPSVKHFAIISRGQASSACGPILRGLVKPENTYQLRLESLTTRGIQPHGIKIPLEEGRLGVVSQALVINIHIDDIALDGWAKEDEFEDMERAMAWLKKHVTVKLWGQPSGTRYRTWDAVQRRAWKEHEDAGSAGILQSVWPLGILR